MLNSLTLIGHAGRDPEVRYFETGSVLCTLTLAVRRIRRKGSEEDEPDWFDLEFWGKTAEIAGEYVRKGSRISINGSLDFNRWTDKSTGDPRERPVVRVDRLDLLDRANAQTSADAPETADT